MGLLGILPSVGSLILLVVSCLNVAQLHAQTTVGPTQLALAPDISRNIAVQTDVLGIVPDDALYLVVAGNVQETRETIERVLRKLNVPFEDEDYKKVNDFVDKLEGWDKKRLHAFALLPDAAGEMQMAFFVPVTDYKKFAKSMGADPAVNGPTEYSIKEGPDGLIVEKAGVAILVEKGQQDFLKRILASNSPVSKLLLPIQPFIAKQQVAGVMLPAGLKKGVDDVLQGLQTFKQQVPAGVPQAATLAGMFDVYGDLLKMARDEVTILAAGVRLDESKGLDVALQVMLKTGGKVSIAAKNIAPLPPQPLKGLPDGEFAVAGAGVFPADWTKSLSEFTLGLVARLPAEAGGYDLTPEQVKELVELSQKSMAGLKRISATMGVGDQTLYGSTCALFQTDDAIKFLDSYEKSIGRMAEIVKKNPATTYPLQQASRRKVDGRDILVVTTDMSKTVEKQTKDQPQLKGMMEAMFGKDGKLNAYLTAVDKQTVALAYDEDGLKNAVTGIHEGQPGLAANEQVAKTAALLPAGAQWVGFLSVGGYFEMTKKAMNAAFGGAGVPGVFPIQIPAFPASVPIGASVQLGPATLEGHIVVPMALMESIRDFVQQMQAQFGG
jgi:hypothetical protein